MMDGCEKALTNTGWGLCHYFLIGFCGFCTMAEAAASLTVPIVTPLMACDMKFKKNDIIVTNAILCLGMAMGAFIYGTLTDSNSRKNSLPITMVIIFCGSVGLSFARKIVLINLTIFVLGFGIAGNNLSLRVYLIECVPAKRRGFSIAILDLFWIFGYLAAFGISWCLVPSVVRMLNHDFRPSSWRVLAGLGGAPSLIMACTISLLPQTPRYLLYRRRPEQALAVLQQIYAINNSRHADRYPPCELEGCIRHDDNGDARSRSVVRRIGKYLKKTWKKIRMIYSPPFRKITFFSTLSRIFLFPGFIWLALWKTHVSLGVDGIDQERSNYLNRHNSSVSSSSSSCVVDVGDIVQAFLHNCHETNNSRFQYALLLSTSYLLGEGLLAIGIDVVGRRLCLLTSGLVGGTAVLALSFPTRYVAKIVLSAVFLAAYSVIYTTTSVLIMENYPTCMRGTAVGLTSVLPHLAAFFVQFFANFYCSPSIYVATGLIIGAALTAIAMPDFTRASMRE